jgi:hypothetical protein
MCPLARCTRDANASARSQRRKYFGQTRRRQERRRLIYNVFSQPRIRQWSRPLLSEIEATSVNLYSGGSKVSQSAMNRGGLDKLNLRHFVLGALGRTKGRRSGIIAASGINWHLHVIPLAMNADLLVFNRCGLFAAAGHALGVERK